MIKIAIIGGSGYSGKELIRLLMGHPKAEIKALFAKSSAGKKLSEVYPLFAKRSELVFETFDIELIKDIELVFLALPHGESMQYAPKLIEQNKKIIDLGGDFRFKDTNVYEKWYKLEHTAKDKVGNFAYGIPELFKDEIKNSNCIANPGCYPTSAILALAPILKTGYVKTDDIIVNSLSGVSGAGRKASVDMIFCEVNETVRAYKVGNHQHMPEIKYILEKYSGKNINPVFIPHLIPVNRGIYSTIYLNAEKEFSLDDVRKYYNNFYKGQPFVRIVDTVPQIQNVNGTNFCDIYIDYVKDSDKVVIISTLDNLIKGAAGQAIQNMNLIFNLKEDEGLYGI
jgi:N-acetyl-gamma-glutamyl-phosphate reductase